MLDQSQAIIERLVELQKAIRDLLSGSRRQRRGDQHAVARDSAADTIYAIDAAVEPMLESFFQEWGRHTPLVLIAEGLEAEDGNEGPRTFPRGTPESAAVLRVIVDPIDGTRGLMYDKRSAWSLAGVAPNRGPATRLRDIEVAVMTELPSSKMGLADTLWAIKGHGGGAVGHRTDLRSGVAEPLALGPSTAPRIDHGFATVASFFPGTKVLAAELMEQLAQELLGPLDVTRAAVFDDQYISTGGQFYELIAGHDRFIADLRPLFYRIQNQPQGLCCHPYDCATWLIAQEAGVILTDGLGQPLDGPMDTTTGLSWAGYANEELRASIEPMINAFLRERGIV
jgi:fructose-1,6-bisphosphatase/inositol monophosphatase family enzyme